MRVLIDASFPLRGASGTAIYVERLTAALREAGVEVVEALQPARRPPGGGARRSLANLVADVRWSGAKLGTRARADGVDLIHHPLPARTLRTGRPQVVTVHDLAFERLPEGFAPAFAAYARLAHRAAARRAAVVVCVSHTTARDVMARWGIPEARIVVAHHGPGQDLPARAGDGAGRHHLLYVGDDEPRKNLGLLLAGYRLYREDRATGAPLPLVVAGRARPNGAGVRIEWRPSRERLSALYREAAALVHPARHEGFGLTPLEAMSTGTPVLAARSPGIVEVCAEAARYFDPEDPRSLAAELARLPDDPAERRELGERGRRRAAQFSWAHSARSHIEAYTLAVEMGAGPPA